MTSWSPISIGWPKSREAPEPAVSNGQVLTVPDFGSWTSAITFVADSRIAYRGRDIGGLIETCAIEDLVWLLLVGSDPTTDQLDAIRRAVVAAADHGVAAPSTAVARTVASTRLPSPAAMAAGLLTFAGPAHGGAAEAAARLFLLRREDEDIASAATRLVESELSAGRRLPGYGHPYHTIDPRVEPLLAAPLQNRSFRELALLMEQELSSRASRRLAINADAAVAALLLDASMTPAAISLVTALGRCIGLAAHVNEEISREQPFRAPAIDTIHFDGHDVDGSL